MAGQWLWKPWRKHAKAPDPWGLDHAKRPVQFLITKPLQKTQTYPPPPHGQLPTALCLCMYGKMPIGTWTR